MKYVLDTDVCVEAIRGREPVISRLQGHSPDDLAISAMTVAELHHGALQGGSNSERYIAATNLFLSPYRIIAFDETAAMAYSEIRFAIRATPIGGNDLVIASTAIANGLVLVTGNVRGFGRVPGLTVENWLR